MALTLWCRACHAGYASVGEIPTICPACLSEADWTTREPPAVAYKLTRDDIDWLRSGGIQPDADPPLLPEDDAA
jgi:hypothetical protein